MRGLHAGAPVFLYAAPVCYNNDVLGRDDYSRFDIGMTEGTVMGHDLQSRLSILTEGAKYDVSCASSGSNRGGRGRLGHACPAGAE